MAGEFIPSYAGYALLHKTAGAAANPAVDTEYVQPMARVVPYNLLGNSYPGIISGSQYPAVVYTGKKRPGFTLFFYCKPSRTVSSIKYGMDADLLNGLLFNLSSTPSVTDRWSLKLYNTVQTRIWDWARCTNVIITGSASGGPLIVQAGFYARWGESEKPANGTVLPDGETVPNDVTWGSPSASGQGDELDDVGDYDFRSDSGLGTSNTGAAWTATHVRGFSLHLMRAIGYGDFLDGTLSPKEVVVGGLTGGLSLEQLPTATTIPSTAATLRIHTNSGASQGIKIAMLLKKDSFDQAEDASLATRTTMYTLGDFSTAGNPATVTSYTPA